MQSRREDAAAVAAAATTAAAANATRYASLPGATSGGEAVTAS